jgi:cyanophycinase
MAGFNCGKPQSKPSMVKSIPFRPPKAVLPVSPVKHFATVSRSFAPVLLLLALAGACSQPAETGEDSRIAAGPKSGTLLLHGGGSQSGVIAERFVELAGGASARLVVIPTAASEIRTSSGVIYNPDLPLESPAGQQYYQDLLRIFGVQKLTVLHTRDRRTADAEEFVAPLRTSTGVWLGPGNAGRLANAYLDTRVHRELANVLARGGVIGGSSAGAIILGSYIVRGRPDKPLLMAKGHERGFGFLKNVAVDPHLLTAQREAELVNVVDAYPHLLGIGIDEETAVEIHGDEAQVIGKSKVAVYDNQKHGATWYYTLEPGSRFNLRSRSVSR